MPRVPRTRCALALLLALASSATAGVDAEIPGRATVRGSFTEDTVETYRFDAVSGSALTLSIATPRRAGADLSLEVHSAELEMEKKLASLDLSDAQVERDQGHRILIKRLPLLSTGQYRIEVSSDVAVDYTLKLSVTPPRGGGETATLGAGETALVPISAPAGSTITLIARAARRSPALPRVTELIVGDDVTDISTEGRPTGRSHVLKLDAGRASGDFTIRYANTGDQAGAVTFTSRVRAPRMRPGRLDVRDRALDRLPGQGAFFARTVGETGGTITVENFETDTDGTSIDVPAAALDAPVIITIASDADFALPDDGTQQAGPTIAFGPAGLAFNADATMTLPLDPTKLPVNVDPETIRVIRKDAQGATEVLVPDDVDLESGTVTVPVSGFSSFVTTVPRGSPQLAGEWWQFLLEAIPVPDGSGPDDSRTREYVLGIGEATFDDDPTPGGDGGFDVAFEERLLLVENGPDDEGAIDGVVTLEETSTNESGAWGYLSDGQRVELDFDADEEPLTLFAAEDGSMLLGGQPVGSGDLAMNLFLRRPSALPTPASVAGTYFVVGLEIEIDGTGPGNPIHTALDRQTSVLTLRADGTLGVTATEASAFFDGTQWNGERESGRTAGSYVIEQDGTLLATFFSPPGEGDEDDVLRFYPGANGQVLFLTDDEPCPDCILFEIAVRQGSRLGKGTIEGDHGLVDVAFGPQFYTVPTTGADRVSDFEYEQLIGTFSADGSGELTVDGDLTHFERDPTAGGGIRVQTESDDLVAGYSVSRTGRLSILDDDTSDLGQIRSDGVFGLYVNTTANADVDFVLGAFLRLPPGRAPTGK